MVVRNPYMVVGNPYMVLGNPYMVADGRAGSRAKLSRGTAAARRTRKTVSRERGRGTAAARRQKKLLFTVPFWWVGDGDGCQVPDPNPALRAGNKNKK